MERNGLNGDTVKLVTGQMNIVKNTLRCFQANIPAQQLFYLVFYPLYNLYFTTATILQLFYNRATMFTKIIYDRILVSKIITVSVYAKI